MMFLKETRLGAVLQLEEAIDAVEDALGELARGRGVVLPRRRIHHPNRMIFGLLPGSYRGVMGAYLQTDKERQIHHETVILYSVESGEPLVCFQDCAINELRTGAAGGVGAKYLARQDAHRVAVLGSAVHAMAQLRAVCAVRDVSQARVFSPTAAHCRGFAAEIERDFAIEAVPVGDAEAAVRGADIVITATNAQAPVFSGEWLEPGMHVTSIANGDKNRVREEIDDITLRRCAPIVVTSKDTVCANESDIYRAVRRGLISWDEVHEMGELILGSVKGRTDRNQITLFKLQGLGIMDLAIGWRAYERLKDSPAVKIL